MPRAALPSALAVALLVPQIASPAPDLHGVWVASGIDRPAFSGSVRVVGYNGTWTATAGTLRVRGRAAHGGTWYQFPNGIGDLWTLARSANVVDAMWVQPGSAIDSNAYASPMTLRALGNSTWVGAVSPYIPRYELYADFTSAPDGSLRGFLRDPIGNFGTMAPFDTVTIAGSDITITTRAHVFHGTIGDDSLRLAIGTGPPMVFRRLEPNARNGFYPLGSHEPAGPKTPVALADGWSVGTLSHAAIDADRLHELTAYLGSQVPTSPGTPYIQSVLVARNDRLVFEQYYYGFDRTRPHDVRSAGKSLDAALLGTAMQRAPDLRVDTSANRWLNYQNLAHPDVRKSQITVGDFLDMTSGLDCDDNNDSSPGNEDTMQSQTQQPDWYRYMMDLPMVRDPGTSTAVYCSGGMNMTGAFIRGATHRWTPAFFDATIARPLHFGEYHLQLMPTDEMYLGGGSYFLPRDFLKLGELFLDGGAWNGHRILSQAWVREATSPHSGLQHPGDYGYSWHLTTYRGAGTTYHAFEAQGNGGQFVVVVPKLGLVVGIMAANYGNYGTWGHFHDLIEQYVVAACR
jgi:CubicO group peptidase (beta-lactamase class C family)